MSIKLEDLQATACAIVKGVECFQGKDGDGQDLARHIYADDGLQNEPMEDSLKSIGWCVAVSMPIAATTKTQTSAGSNSAPQHGASAHDVLFVVSVRTNPRRNKGDKARNVLLCVRSIIKAFLSWKPSNGDRGFFLPEERAFEPDFEDAGNVTYDIRFLKNVPL